MAMRKQHRRPSSKETHDESFSASHAADHIT